MAKGPMYVKDFDFSAKPCNYSYGGSAKAGQDVQMAKSNAVAKSLVGQKMTKMASGGYYAKGGKIKEAATGESYPSRRAMMKHESMETPSMQKEEIMQSRMVKAPTRRAMPVAPSAPMVQPGAMKKGGFVPAGSGMVKTEGTLGIKGNKNPGEMNGKPTTATKTGNVPYKMGGGVKKYADGGPMMPARTGMRSGANMPPAALQAMKMAAMKAQAMRGAQQNGMPMRAMGGQMPPQGAPQMDGKANMMKTGGKVAKVMGEFKAGELHSGSKSGPAVKSRKQAVAIALSEARKAAKK
jgi:hypothetical protein